MKRRRRNMLAIAEQGNSSSCLSFCQTTQSLSPWPGRLWALGVMLAILCSCSLGRLITPDRTFWEVVGGMNATHRPSKLSFWAVLGKTQDGGHDTYWPKQGFLRFTVLWESQCLIFKYFLFSLRIFRSYTHQHLVLQRGPCSPSLSESTHHLHLQMLKIDMIHSAFKQTQILCFWSHTEKPSASFYLSIRYFEITCLSLPYQRIILSFKWKHSGTIILILSVDASCGEG